MRDAVESKIKVAEIALTPSSSESTMLSREGNLPYIRCNKIFGKCRKFTIN
jgi:hypothetical protein